MKVIDKTIDKGRPFDWDRAAEDYAKYRDIYPQAFYDKIIARALCVKGQRVLDVGTGTGVLPRNLYRYGAQWTGIDSAREQIAQAKLLSKGKEIEYFVRSAEEAGFPSESFDLITACQCFWYFDHERTTPLFYDILKPGGRLLVLYMAWLPFEDEIAGASESLVLKYNPAWSGAGETMRPIPVPDRYREQFSLVHHEEYPLKVRFTRESWNGRMKACRGVGASLSEREVALWESEHKKLLEEIAPAAFDILHYGALAELQVKK